MIDATNLPLALRTPPPVPAGLDLLWRGWEPGDAKGALDRVGTIVNAMTGDSHDYRVVIDEGIATAATTLGTRRVAVTGAALVDEAIEPAMRLAVTTGLAVHEAGHVRHGRATANAAIKRWPHGDPDRSDALRLSNILDDVRLEARYSRSHPAFGGSFRCTLWWVARRHPARVDHLPRTRTEALNFAIAAARYDDLTVWSPDPAVAAERAWWRAWAAAHSRNDTAKLHIAGIEAAIARIAPLPERLVVAPGWLADAPETDDDDPEGAPVATEPGDDEPEDDEPDDDEDDDPAPRPIAVEPEAEPDGGEPDAPVALPLATEPEDDEPDEDEADDDSDAATSEPEGDEEDEAPYRRVDADDDFADEGEGDDGAPSEGGTPTFGDGPRSGGEEPDDRGLTDGLTDPMPLHVAETLSDDDRMKDRAIARNVAVSARIAAAATDGRDARTVTVTIGESEDTVSVRPTSAGEAPYVDPAGVAALRAAFAGRKLGHDSREVGRSGRVSPSRAYRVRAGDDRVFTRRQGYAPDRLDLHLLVDASGSMTGQRLRNAIKLAATVAEAMAGPTARVHVWGHTTGNGTIVYDSWDSRRGDDPATLAGIVAGGSNNDASALAAVIALADEDRSEREKTVVAVLSDGAPCQPEAWVASVAEDARRRGIGVVSVAVAGGLTPTQEAMYGADGAIVAWYGDWDRLATELAAAVGTQA